LNTINLMPISHFNPLGSFLFSPVQLFFSFAQFPPHRHQSSGQIIIITDFPFACTLCLWVCRATATTTCIYNMLAGCPTPFDPLVLCTKKEKTKPFVCAKSQMNYYPTSQSGNRTCLLNQLFIALGRFLTILITHIILTSESSLTYWLVKSFPGCLPVGAGIYTLQNWLH
jgi:hypothetical protein